MADDEPEIVEEVLYAEPPGTPQHVAPIAGALAPSPYSYEFTGEDTLWLTAWNSVVGTTIVATCRMRRIDGSIQVSRQEFPISADRADNTVSINPGPGYLLTARLRAFGSSPRIGQTFVKLQLVRGAGSAAYGLGTLLQGYITSNQDLGWPGSPITHSLDLVQPVRMIQGTTPAAGNEISEVVPSNARWEHIVFAAALTTSAVAGDRRPLLRARDGTTVFLRSAQPNVLPASSTATFIWGSGLPLETTISAQNYQAALPIGLTLTAGQEIQTLTIGLQAGDQWGPPLMLNREWLEIS